MGYLGLTPTTAQQNYLNIDDISGSFNGTTTSFALQVGGVAPSPFPVTNSCLISVGGVVQQPDDTGTDGFRISGGNIIFSSAPGTGEDFFGLVLAGADYLNVGANFPDGTVGTPSITFASDLNTGIYHPSADSIAITSGGTAALTIDSNRRLGLGTSSPSRLFHVSGTTDTPAQFQTSQSNLYIQLANSSASNGYIGFEGTNLSLWNNGANRLNIDSSGKVGIGTTSPSRLLHLSAADSTSFSSADFDQTYNFLRIVNTTNDKAAGIYFGIGSNGEAAITAAETSDGETALTFGTRGSGTRSERARIDSKGTLLVGTATVPNGSNTQYTKFGVFGNNLNSGASVLSLSYGAAATSLGAGTGIGRIYFGDTGASEFASVSAETDGTTGSGDYPGRLVFYTTANGASSPTERARITSTGNFVVGKTTGIGSIGTAGFDVGSTGYVLTTVSGDPSLYCNRLTNDGVLAYFAQDNSIEGSISVSGTTVSYNGAHLSRWSQLPGGAVREEILRGTVLSNIDEMCAWGEEANEQLNRMKVSDVEGDKNVSGVFQAWDDDDDTYTDDFYCAMTGDFVIRIAQGVTVERGDLLMSAGDGTAKPQDDDIIRSKTIAKVTSTHVSETYADGSYCVPCVLMAC